MSHDGVGEVTEALTGLVSDFKGFRQDITQKMKQQEERLNMTYMSQRPQLSTSDMVEAPHQKAMDAYLRSGDDDGLRSLALEGKSMNTAVSAEGGYLVDPQTAETVKSVLTSSASIRSIATVVNVEATSFDVLVDRTEMGAGWATENGSTQETDTSLFDRISIPLHELSAMPKASQRLLDDAAFDVEGWLATRIADKFATSEAAAFITGDGIDKPRGFLVYPNIDEQSWTWGSLGYVATGASGDFEASKPSDAIVDLVYALGAKYRANASFVMNSKTAGAVRKMKDADGRFLWTDSLAAGQPAQLMGYPVLIAEDMPDIGVDTTAIAFGDFGAGYTVAERPDLRVLRDPFSAKPHVLFYATKRVGGDVTDFSAIKLLKFTVV
ncbi:MAG: phage major capsid protein [Jannaschia helgolandensis]|jgi:HK97 family phage major capsid protein|uniref:Phage major capsid protein, HK97 family n=1 Tax=Jannaschia helgolandensis TaxID=188906 RepID=A0A1H7NTX0_9RHOB|nr:phage major capsid protein [Jannaschia helgolandensis]SEL26856.1 phage major capsid protein, HK97 family [Jannaschia helgolandensis]